MNISLLHYLILKFIIENGFAPTVTELAEMIGTTESEIQSGLQILQDGHGVVLHPNNHKIWVIHPFSLAPTNFLISTGTKKYWGNCAWCSLGAAALLKTDCTITTTIGAENKQIEIKIVSGKITPGNLFIHFPVPMKNAWDNVIYTCSTMLMFENKTQVSEWCKNHRIPQGDIQPIENMWEFSKVWYGNHLNPEWKKWTSEEAKEIFIKFGLTGNTWDIPGSADRF